MFASNRTSLSQQLSRMALAMIALATTSCLTVPTLAPTDCGDGRVHKLDGEECDDDGESAFCDIDCTWPVCGDGHRNMLAGEDCDDGNTVAGDGCNAYCKNEICGDGVVDESAGEQCDPRDAQTEPCNLDCTLPRCGDNYINPAAGEECDSGGESLFCDGDCTIARCGDGLLNTTSGEACDDGNTAPGDGCDSLCQTESCGNGVLDAGEQCDGSGETATCNIDCTVALCGDSKINPSAGEECDDGNPDDSDWCVTTCRAATCNDGIRNADEEYVDCGGHCGDPSCDPGSSGKIATGNDHTCLLLDTGAVRCWGNNQFGQLGYGHTAPIGDNEFPATASDVDVGGHVIQIGAGGNHTCALLDTGAVRCWGRGEYGQLGYYNLIDEETNPNIGDDEVPATAGDVEVGGRVVQIAAGEHHNCALLDTGDVRCWGHGGSGRLGYGNSLHIGDDEAPATPGDVTVGERVSQIVAGGAHTCALLETAAVRCWGLSGYGQLGYGDTRSISVPAVAGDVNIGGRVARLAAGTHHTCAVLETSGKVRCWGYGLHGRLGYASTDNVGDDELPTDAGDVDVGGSVGQIATGGSHTCARLKNGAVRCWGYGLHGQLGYADTRDNGDDEPPAEAGAVNVGGWVAQIATGMHHTCALLEEGNVRCWGYGASGRLGYGNSQNVGDDEHPADAGDVPYR
jgi:cysteine-rich repeat protein